MERLGVKGGAYIGVGPDQNYTYIARIAAAHRLPRRHPARQHAAAPAVQGAVRARVESRRVPGAVDGPAGAGRYRRLCRPADRRHSSRWIDSTAATPASAERAQDRSCARSCSGAACRSRRRISPPSPDSMTPSSPTASRCASPVPGGHRSGTTRRCASSSSSTTTDGQQRGYLAAEADFQFVKSMHRRNLIVPVTGDLAGPRTLAGIARYLAEIHEPRVGAVRVERRGLPHSRRPLCLVRGGCARAAPRTERGDHSQLLRPRRRASRIARRSTSPPNCCNGWTASWATPALPA